MSKYSTFLQYLKTREGGFSLLLVIICGFGLSFFIGLTFVDRLPALYHLDFGKAQWIEAATPSVTNYFRKTIYLGGPVDRAWIQISATDRYDLFVNNTLVETHLFDRTCVTGLYDLRGKLQLGKNVIAVAVARDSYPGSAQIIVRGFYRIVGSPVQEFCSGPGDDSWRASNTPDGIVGGWRWSDPHLDDSFWSLPKVAPEKDRFRIQPVNFDPRLLESEPTGKWIAQPPGSGNQASFAYNFRIPANRRETWLELAATGNYDLFINDRLITTTTVLAVSGTVASPAAQALTTRPVLQGYDITRWVHSGINSLLIRVSSQTLAPAFLLADGYTVLDNGKLERFATDGSWDTFSYGKNHQPALVVGIYGDQPWGDLVQRLGGAVQSPIYDLLKILTWGAVLAVVLGGLLALWALSSPFASLVSRVPVQKLWTCDALWLLCVTVGMLFLWLLTYDVRFDYNWCFKPNVAYGLIIFVLAGRLVLLLPRKSSVAKEATSPERPERSHWLRPWQIGVLICIAGLGFFLRARNITAVSLDTDEFGLIQFSRGVQKKGFPYIRLGSFEKDITTYELVPFSIAASRQILGETETAFRTHSLIYATLEIALIGLIGTRMMGWRVGLTAALIFATYPCGLYFGVNAFWPSQQLLFALTVLWCFYEAIRAGPLRHGFLTVATGALILAYYSWEGTGFLIPTLILLMFAMRWGKYDWMKDWHLWRCFVVLGFAVGMQLTFRQVESQPPYLQTGISLSDVTAPEPTWLNLSNYFPDFYFKNCLLAENFFVMTSVVLCGIWFCWRDRAIRYLFLTISTLIFWYSMWLPSYAERYSYDSQSVLILLSTGILFKLFDRIAKIGASRLRWAAVAGLLVTFVLGTNGFVLQTYRLSAAPARAFYAYRMGVYRRGYREAARFVADHFRPGDCLVVAIPHIFEYYSKLHVDYSFNTMLDKKITYSGALEVPHFLDKFRGYPCVRSLEELQDLRSRYKRIWIVQVPYEIQQPEVTQYINQNAKTAFMTYTGEVDLLVATSYPTQVYVR